jgi:predicted DNA binding CopG/RHH family protein
MSEGKTATAAELDQMFDDGEDISDYLDFSKATRPGRAVKRVNVDFPVDLVMRLDREARRRGVTRQALIKMWLADRLDQAA